MEETMKSFINFISEGEVKKANRILRSMVSGQDSSSNNSDDGPDTEEDEKENKTLKDIAAAGADRGPDNSKKEVPSS